jgi:hypothetical protein
MDSRGSIVTWIPAPGVLMTRAEGYLCVAFAQCIVDAGNDVVAGHGRLLGFHDWSRVRGYDSDSRVKLTEWGLSIRASVDRVHILFASKLVRMGVAVASIALSGMIVAYDDPSRFGRELETAVRERRPGSEHDG